MMKIFDLFKDPILIIRALLGRGFFNWLSDEKYLKLRYYVQFRRSIDLDTPSTYNEKIQWLKLYNCKPEYTAMVDKYEVKKYVADRIGSQYIIPTLGVWDRFEDIDFDLLPDQFVLKCTHDSGGLVICNDKSKLDIDAAKKKIKKSLARNYYYLGREWPYKDVKPRIIAEKYLNAIDQQAELVEYKFFCFDGKAKMILVCKGKAHGAGRTNDYCDLELNRLPFISLNPNSTGKLEMPVEMPGMIRIAEKLSENIPQLRVDLYLADGHIYFGELTFFHNSGFCRFEPEEWDQKLGDWIRLPK